MSPDLALAASLILEAAVVIGVAFVAIQAVRHKRLNLGLMTLRLLAGAVGVFLLVAAVATFGPHHGSVGVKMTRLPPIDVSIPCDGGVCRPPDGFTPPPIGVPPAQR